MKIFKHIRGKSDTDFYIDKLLLDNIHYNIKSYKPTNENNGNDDIDISYSMILTFLIQILQKIKKKKL